MYRRSSPSSTSGVTVLLYRQDSLIFSPRTAYFRAANFSDFARARARDRDKESERERETIASRFDFSSGSRSLFDCSCVRRCNFHFHATLPTLYSHVAFALDTAGGIARTGGESLFGAKKTVGRERERERNTHTHTHKRFYRNSAAPFCEKAIAACY